MPELPLSMSWLWLAVPMALLGAAVGLLAALLERSGPIRLRHWAEEAGGSLRQLYRAPRRFEAVRLLLDLLAKTLPLVAFAGMAGVFLGRLPLAAALVLAGVLSLGPAAVGEVASRVVVGRDPEGALRRATRLYRALLIVFGPALLLARLAVPKASLQRREENGEDEASDEEIEAFIHVGTREGILEPDESDLVRGVVDFGDTQVRSVMTPRIDMVCAPVDSDLESLARLFLESKHSRVPLYRDSIDHIVGVLHIRDILGALREPVAPSAESLAKPTTFVPETKPLDDLLRLLQAERQQMAIVVDEYGGTAGLVTVEDLIEEIVGEIVDEHEEAVPAAVDLGDGRWRLDGKCHLEVLAEIFGVQVGEVPYETIGGLVFNALGNIPKPGGVVETRGLCFTVEQVAERRIQSVIVRRAEEPCPEPGDA